MIVFTEPNLDYLYNSGEGRDYEPDCEQHMTPEEMRQCQHHRGVGYTASPENADTEQHNADHLYWFPVKLRDDDDGRIHFERSNERCMWFAHAVKEAKAAGRKLIGKYTNDPAVTGDEFIESYVLISVHDLNEREIYVNEEMI